MAGGCHALHVPSTYDKAWSDLPLWVVGPTWRRVRFRGISGSGGRAGVTLPAWATLSWRGLPAVQDP